MLNTMKPFSVLALLCFASTVSAAPDDAQNLIARMRTAYQALRSFSTIAHLEASGLKASGLKEPVDHRFSIAVEKPAKFVVVTVPNSVPDVLSDGVSLFTFRPKATPVKYLKTPMPPAEYGSEVLMQDSALGPSLTPLLAGVDFFSPPWGHVPQSLRKGEPTTVDNVPVDVLIAEFANADGTKETHTYFSDANGLLRRFEQVAAVRGKTLTFRRTYEDIKINPALPAETLVFTPPPGAVEVQEWEPPVMRLKPGDAPPNFQARDLAEKKLRLADYKGKVVLLEFWATWCGPCHREMPHVCAAYQKFHDQGFDVVGISADLERAKLEAFVNQEKVPWRQVFDRPFGPIHRLFLIDQWPFFLLIGRDGRVAAINPQRLFLDVEIRKALQR